MIFTYRYIIGLTFIQAALQIFTRVSIIAEASDPLERQFGTLKHASVLHRHGDRGPIRSYPLDPYKNYPWPGGYGQLINAGKRRLFEVGKWFRIRYENFANTTYLRKHIRVDSSELDRCVMSAQCFLYGLYPATGEQIWLENEKWQPIPVFPIPGHDDNKIQQKKACKLLSVLRENEAADPKYEMIYEQYKPVIELIINETGIDVNSKTKMHIFKGLSNIAGTFLVYVQNNLTLPSWTKNVYPEPLRTILLKTVKNFVFSIQRVRLESGPFLESVVTDMRRKIEDEKYEQKLHLYSGHDTTIRSIMGALKVYDDVWPSYGSSLIFELREKNSTNYVTVSYRNNTNEPNARLLDVPGCGLTCTFEQFHILTKPLIPENWNRECESTSYSPKRTANAIITPVLIYLLYLFK